MKLTKEEKLLQAIDNLQDAIYALESEGASEEYLKSYREPLSEHLHELAVLRHTQRQKDRRSVRRGND